MNALINLVGRLFRLVTGERPAPVVVPVQSSHGLCHRHVYPWCLAVLWVAASVMPAVGQALPGRAEIAVFCGKTLAPEALADLGALDRAWLRAAEKPALERARAFLALADAHPELGERALLGAAGAVLAARRLAMEVPGLEPRDHDWVDDRDESLSRIEILFEPWIRRLEELRQRLERTGASAEGLAEADWMLRVLRRTGCAIESMHVPTGQELRIPAPRPHDLELRWFRAKDGEPDALRFDRSGAGRRPESTVRVPAGREAVTTRVPEPGSWWLELREIPSGWRHLRPVRVSDLAFDALALGTHVVVYARLQDRPAAGAAVTVRSRDGHSIAAGTCDERGVALLPVPEAALENPAFKTIRLEVRTGAHQARALLRGLGRPLQVQEELRAHGFCERPLYRPGQTVRGRIVVRRVKTIRGAPHGALVRSRSCTLRLRSGRRLDQRLQVFLKPNGVLTFETQIPKTVLLGRVEGELQVDGRTVPLGALFRVDPFRRSPLLVDLRAPARLEPGQDAWAEVRARWSHGAPASGAPVGVRARMRGMVQEIETRLGRDGTLRIRLPRDEAFFVGTDRDIELTATVRGPDGQGVTRTCTVCLPEPAEPEERYRRFGFVDLPKTARPGEPFRVVVDGRPGVPVLCVLRSRNHLEARTARLDGEGRAELTYTLPRDARNRVCLELAAAGWHVARSVRLVSPARDLTIALETGPRTFLPGKRCRLAFRVTDGQGRPVRAVLSVSLVDERLLALEDVDDQAAIQRFGRLEWRWQSFEANDRPEAKPWHLIGEMLAHGRPGVHHPLRAYSGPAGGIPPTVLDALELPDELLRTRFCPSAGFRACLLTDRNGRASYDLELPDDLTTWRLRAVAVDEALGQGAARFRLVTKKPLSVETALPRLLRQGDCIRTVPVVSGPAGERIAWAVRAGDELAVEHGKRLEDGLELTARTPGQAELELGVRAGALGDAVKRTLRIERNTVREKEQAVTSVAGAWRTLALPGADELESLVVGAGRAARLAELRAELADYPYGCAEQTSSRLLGLYGRAVPELAISALEAETLFGRLIWLWRPRSLLFAWWPGGKGDPGISALVLHTLCELRAAGHPLERYGLSIDAGAWTTEWALERIVKILQTPGDRPDAEDLARLEHAMALLRFMPRNPELLTAVEARLASQETWPRGLWCRAGLMLAEVGKREDAIRIARAMSDPATIGGAGLKLGELTRVTLAFELRLRQTLGLHDVRTEQLEEELLAHIEKHGFQNTWSAASALHALDRSGRQEPLPVSVPVEVRIEGTLRTFELNAANGYRVKLALEGRPEVQVRSPSGAEVRARLVGARYRAAETWPARSRGLTLTRSLSGHALGSSLRPGQVYDLTLEVSAERPAHYLVVRCPMPAGLEVQGDPAGIERHNDSIVATLPYVDPADPRRIQVPVAFGFTGSVLWPPARVHDMYGEELQACTEGSRLCIEPDRPSGAHEEGGEPAATAVLTVAWREKDIDVLLEKALKEEDADDARWTLDNIRDHRLPLTRAQCARWLEPLFLRHGHSPDFCETLLDMPGVPEAPEKPVKAFELVWALHQRDYPLELRGRILEEPDGVFAPALPAIAHATEYALEDGIDRFLRVGDWIRHESVAACPEALSRELALAEALFNRAEAFGSTWSEAAIRALESLADIDVTDVYRGAAEGPVEAGVRKRLTGLKARAAELRARHAPPEPLTAEVKLAMAREQHRWNEIPQEKWPVELSTLEREDVAALKALGPAGVRYLVEQAGRGAEIDDETHWLNTLASGPVVDLAVLTPFLVEGWWYSKRQRDFPGDRLARVTTAQLVDACRHNPAPHRRTLFLTELARRGQAFPLQASHPAEQPYHLFWQCLHHDARSHDALRALLDDLNTPEEFVVAAWRALLPDPGYCVFESALYWMTDREHQVVFAHLTPAERRRALHEIGLHALPATLSDALLRELCGELWARILADADAREALLDRFLQSAGGFALLHEQLDCGHTANYDIASMLLRYYGLSVPFRTPGGLVLRMEADDTETREYLALLWLEGDIAVPVAHLPHDVVLRVLRRRGCSLR